MNTVLGFRVRRYGFKAQFYFLAVSLNMKGTEYALETSQMTARLNEDDKVLCRYCAMLVLFFSTTERILNTCKYLIWQRMIPSKIPQPMIRRAKDKRILGIGCSV